jgi:tetratricopeptide (TPR) repeat protein
MFVPRAIRTIGKALAFTVMALSVAAGQEISGGRTGVDVRRGDDPTSRGSIRGRVVTPGGRYVLENLKVTLLTIRGVQSIVYTGTQGSFEFTELTPGNYEVQVETVGAEYQVVNQAVQVFKGTPSVISIPLNDRSTANNNSARGSISVSELGADVPKPAKKEFEAATKAADSGKPEEAIAHLRKAINLYPNFAMARNNLGVQLLAAGRLDEAVTELEAAIKIDPKAFNPRLNLGIVLVERHDFDEAAMVLDRALAMSSDSPAAHLYDGLAHMAMGNLAEAQKQFQTAYTVGGNSYSVALFHLGQVYMSEGEREQALHAFEDYLHESPQAANADQVRKLIALLK